MPRSREFANDNEGTVSQRLAHLEFTASITREDLAKARACLAANPYDQQLAKQVRALHWLLKELMKAKERLERQKT